ncbi:uncharacterized protein LOC132046010 [Lycium ferocissimum]|uniref:uncharacterized protein LOC132046010 n=1 Tax=Lycium ferocissimum TaxID=112874 RepID=UPI002814F876|nr:uncharacterized protein LOC132046010 [Lycium ferocissimum]
MTKKGDDETIESYVKRLKSIADSRAAMGIPISDWNMVLKLLAGLPSEYEPVKKLISRTRPLLTFEDACSMVSMQEHKFLQDHHEESSAFTTLEKVGTVVGVVSLTAAAVVTLPTVAGAVGASRMIVARWCSVCSG